MAVSGVGSLTSDQFLQLFITQLQNQDPSAPMDANALTTQLAQLSTVESITKLSASFDQMLQLQQLTQGNDLLGHTIQYKGTNGTTQSGAVSSVSVQNGNVLLNIGSAAVP